MVFSRGFLRVRRSTRAFARAPGLTLVLLLTIAVGVGSNAAIFGFLEGLIHPAPVLRGPDRIVSVLSSDRARVAAPLSASEFQLIRRSHDVFEWAGAARIRQGNVAIDGRTKIATIASVTSDVSAAFGLRMRDGVVISHRMWENEFGGKEEPAGFSVRVDGANFKIDGIAPEKLEGMYSDQSVDLWVSAKKEDVERERDRRDLWVLARLRDGISADEAETALHSQSGERAECHAFHWTRAEDATRIDADWRVFELLCRGGVLHCVHQRCFLSSWKSFAEVSRDFASHCAGRDSRRVVERSACGQSRYFSRGRRRGFVSGDSDCARSSGVSI